MSDETVLHSDLRKTIEGYADTWIDQATHYEKLIYWSRGVSVAASIASLIAGFVTKNPEVTGIIGAIPAAVTLLVTEMRWRDLVSWHWNAATEAWGIFNKLAYDLSVEEKQRTIEAEKAWNQLLQKNNMLRAGIFTLNATEKPADPKKLPQPRPRSSPG